MNCPYRTFVLTQNYPGRTRQVKQQIVEMTLNGSGVRDIARVLHTSPTTVINELKKTPTVKPAEDIAVLTMCAPECPIMGHLSDAPRECH